MSDMLVDMQQPLTAETLTNTNQYNKKYNNNNYVYESDPFNNNNKNMHDNINSKTPDVRYSSQHSTTTYDTTAADDADVNANADNYDDFANILSLQLRKPKHWRWELSTSRTCANIALPRILLYDHKGQLLVDANSQEEQCFSQPKKEQAQTKRQEEAKQTSTDAQSRPLKRASKAATSNLVHSIRKALDRQFSGLQIQEATPSPGSSKNRSVATTPTTERTPSTPLLSAIDFYTNELPDYKLQRRANSLKGVRFKVKDDLKVNTDLTPNKNVHNSFNLADLPTPPSTITTTTTPTNSSSSGPREKRRYRRSHSSARSPATSESILERFSFNKGRYSSPEYAEEKDVYHSPRYFLRTCNAGTLVVQQESFSRYRRRRRPRNNSSTENIQSCTGSGSKSSQKMSESGKQAAITNGVSAEQSCGSLWNVSEQEQGRIERKKVYPVRRHRSDGNVLLHRHSISSDEETEKTAAQVRTLETEKVQRAQRKYGNRSRKQRKSELIIIDPENDVQPGGDCSESR